MGMTWGDWFGFLWHQLTMPRISWLVYFVSVLVLQVTIILWRAWRDNA